MCTKTAPQHIHACLDFVDTFPWNLVKSCHSIYYFLGHLIRSLLNGLNDCMHTEMHKMHFLYYWFPNIFYWIIPDMTFYNSKKNWSRYWGVVFAFLIFLKMPSLILFFFNFNLSETDIQRKMDISKY